MCLTLLTRVGEGTKLVLLGDSNQSDTPNYIKDGLADAVNRLRDCPDVGIVEFTKEDIVRSTIVKEIIKRYE
jgi:phosphate starvation-inducible protein PhoH